MKRRGSAIWKGGLKDGRGTVSSDSGVLPDTQYSFSTRFEEGKGTNPEELIAAAHAGCFSMALSGQLGNAGLVAESIKTTAAVTLEKTDAGFTITTVHLDVSARIPDADQQVFVAAANNAKAGCPVSRLLNAEIIRQGYGNAYTRYPFDQMERFRQYEREAIEQRRGLWVDETPIEPSEVKTYSERGPPSSAAAAGITVYVTRTGRKYHRATCRHLRRSKIPVSIEEAKAQGYTPCAVCNPTY